MKLTGQMISQIRASMDAMGMTKMDLSRAARISHTTVGRWFSGKAKKITDETAERVSNALKIPLQEMIVLSMGGWPEGEGYPEHRPGCGMRVMEARGEYKTRDRFDRLAEWLRNEACEETQNTILGTARLGGFMDRPTADARGALDCAG